MPYKPRQGDIIYIDFNPQLGHEQKGRRPALVVWNNELLNKIPSMSMVCAISTTDNGFPLHVKIDDKTKKISGYIFCEQNKVLDIKARNAKYIDHVSNDVLDQVINILIASVER